LGKSVVSLSRLCGCFNLNVGDPPAGRSPSRGRSSLGYPKNNIILVLVGMYLYSAILDNKH